MKVRILEHAVSVENHTHWYRTASLVFTPASNGTYNAPSAVITANEAQNTTLPRNLKFVYDPSA